MERSARVANNYSLDVSPNLPTIQKRKKKRFSSLWEKKSFVTQMLVWRENNEDESDTRGRERKGGRRRENPG